jgi:hypothetical protein
VNRDAGAGAGDARCYRESIPSGAGSWEPSERVGGEHLRGTAVVNAGSTGKNAKASEERSERTGSSPQSFLKGQGSRRSTRTAGTIAG